MHVCHSSPLIRRFSNNRFATVIARDPRSSTGFSNFESSFSSQGRDRNPNDASTFDRHTPKYCALSLASLRPFAVLTSALEIQDPLHQGLLYYASGREDALLPYPQFKIPPMLSIPQFHVYYSMGSLFEEQRHIFSGLHPFEMSVCLLYQSPPDPIAKAARGLDWPVLNPSR